MITAAVDFLANPLTLTVVDDAWARAAAAEGITLVRAAITADETGRVHWPLVQTGAAAWKRAGVAVDGVLAYEYLPPFTDEHGVLWCPNSPVGTGTHRLTTPYIERFRLQLQSQASALVAAGIEGFYAWNESQVGLVKAGQQCPPDGRVNRSCLAPDVYASLVWQTCASLAHVGCTRRIAGALSVLPQTGLDARNPYLRGYLTAVYAHLHSCGVRPNWTHLGLTMEGYWTVATAQKVRESVRATMEAHGDSAELLVAEWGVRNHGVDATRLLETRDALVAVFGNPAYFSRPGLVPYLGPVDDYGDYGAVSWREAGGRFVLGAKYPIGHILFP